MPSGVFCKTHLSAILSAKKKNISSSPHRLALISHRTWNGRLKTDMTVMKWWNVRKRHLFVMDELSTVIRFTGWCSHQSSLTRSYTVVPVLYADGTLGEKLFVVLAEPDGQFPQSGYWSAPNLCLVAGTSHIMRKDQVPSLISKCVMSGSYPTTTIALLDSWPGLKDHANILSGVPPGKHLKMMTVPPGATALCQPLDVYFLRLFKRYIRRIHESAVHMKPEFCCFSRNNILKVLSQTYRQFCAPRFRECFKYAWFAAGYIDSHPEPFTTPTDFSFNEDPVDDLCRGTEHCSSHAFVRCCWCEKLYASTVLLY
ncbi:unnamed protein product [Nippostrongylus brasiliensis]|uniref:Transp_Tc5_C domain-containing protein n=1 Tax=Nippostrongylus brasiliensis TaxID=27835 RepID=A0A0N4YKI4_NIPBR|nr:unnamed protein product [Nippostrongylus brasiliensis]